MPFSIGFHEPPSYPYDDPATPQAKGILILGEAKEYFGSSLYQWSKKEYESQWGHAIKTLLDGKDRAYWVRNLRCGRIWGNYREQTLHPEIPGIPGRAA